MEITTFIVFLSTLCLGNSFELNYFGVLYGNKTMALIDKNLQTLPMNSGHYTLKFLGTDGIGEVSHNSGYVNGFHDVFFDQNYEVTYDPDNLNTAILNVTLVFRNLTANMTRYYYKDKFTSLESNGSVTAHFENFAFSITGKVSLLCYCLISRDKIQGLQSEKAKLDFNPDPCDGGPCPEMPEGTSKGMWANFRFIFERRVIDTLEKLLEGILIPQNYGSITQECYQYLTKH